MPGLIDQINTATGFKPPTGMQYNQTNPAPAAPAPAADSSMSAYLKALASLQSSMYQYTGPPAGQIVGGFNTSAAHNAAAAAATNTDTAYYNNLLNQYNTNMAQQQGYAQQQNQNTIQGIQENTQNVLNQNTITGQRTGEDLNTTLSNMANSQQNQLSQTGLGDSQQQQAQLSQQGSAGTAESGLGAQQQSVTQQGQALGSQAEQQGYDVQKAAQNLFANRTMADLSRGSDIAQQQSGLQQNAANFSLSSYLSQLQQQQQQYAETNAASLKTAIGADTSLNYGTAVNNFLQGLSTNGAQNSANYNTTATALRGAY